MEFLTVLYIVILLILLVFSSLFSGSETAFFSLNHLEKDRLLRRSKGRIGRFVAGILFAPEDILITLLTGNMIVNLFFASLMDRLVLRFVSDNTWLYSIILGTVFLLIFGEMTPKSFAIRHSLKFFNFTSRFLFYIHIFLSPIRRLLKILENRVIALVMGGVKEEETDSRMLISSTLQVGLQKGIVHPSELAVLETFFDLREKTAEEVMIPRTAMKGLDVKTGLPEVIRRVKKMDRRNPIAVFDKDLDHLVGYFNLRDLLSYYRNGGNRSDLKTIVKPVHPVPEKKNLFELLREMVEAKKEMAVVVDEYGGTAGIVTFQHLIEDFLDFFYPSDEEGIVRVSKGVFRVPGHIDLDEIENLLDVELISENRTVAGLLMERLGSIPARGTGVRIEGQDFIVRRVGKNRIIEVEIRKVE